MIINKFAVLLLVMTFSVYAAETDPGIDESWHPDVSLTIGTNDNLGRAELNRDIVDDDFASITAGIGRTLQLNPAQTLSMRGFAQREQWKTVTEMSKTSLGGRVATDWIPFIGDAPIAYDFNMQLRLDQFGVKQRDSTVFTSQLIASKPIGDRFQASLGVEYNDNDSEGTVWDLHHVRGFLTGTFIFYPRWSAHGTYSYIDGLIWSTVQTTFADGTAANDIFGLISASEAIEPDEAFNDAFCGECEWHAYRLEAETNVFELGLDGELDHNIGLNLSFLAIDVKANGNNDYKINVITAGVSKGF